MVECSPATRAARVRFPADAHVFVENGPIHTFHTSVNDNLEQKRGCCHIDTFREISDVNPLFKGVYYNKMLPSLNSRAYLLIPCIDCKAYFT